MSFTTQTPKYTTFLSRAGLLVILFLMTSLSLSGQIYSSQGSARSLVPKSGERYVTDEYGTIRMYVNVWGHVNRPGSYLVYDGIDLATLLSQSGGPKNGANYRKVMLFREQPDKDGNMVYEINLEDFIRTGNRIEFVEILPNDTIMIKQEFISAVFSKASTLNTLMSMLNLYLSISINSSR
jgi:hypothetical protein